MELQKKEKELNQQEEEKLKEKAGEVGLKEEVEGGLNGVVGGVGELKQEEAGRRSTRRAKVQLQH